MSNNKDMLSTIIKRSEVKPESSGNSGTSYEVFRNNTTAVEVVVKDVFRGKKKTTCENHHDDIKQHKYDMKVDKLQDDVERLKMELENAKKSLVRTRKGVQGLVRAMVKQIDTVNARESDAQAKNVYLSIENEKLKIIVESKTKLLSRMKKEVSSMKRVLKFVIKSVCHASEFKKHQNCIESDPDYEDFEVELKKNRLKLNQDFTETFDTTDNTNISKDYLFDEKL